MSHINKIRPAAYVWDFDGSAAPTEIADGFFTVVGSWKTFSVGVFQWVPTKRGDGLKRSKAVRRFGGPVAHAGKVFDQAYAECARLTKEGVRA